MLRTPTGRLRRVVSRLTADPEELEARDTQQVLRSCGASATPMAGCCAGEVVEIAGVLRQVSLRPRAGAPALAAELYDGTGSVTLIWLGRRRIAGIEAGRHLRATGRLSAGEDGQVMFNPAYELLVTGGAS